MLEKDYPYTGMHHSCKYDATKTSGVSADQTYRVMPHNVEQLKAAVALQPVVGAVHGFLDEFM